MSTFLRDEALACLHRYLDVFPHEAAALQRLHAQLQGPEDCFLRSNMAGHVTSSVAVLNEQRSHILLIHHRFLQIWLPPGGHYEPPGSLWDSAMREVEEETGVHSLTPHPWFAATSLPIDIDTHSVPQNPAKAEGPHLHHDFRYLAVAADERELTLQLSEVLDARWTPVAELRSVANRRLVTLADKLDELQCL